MSDFATPRQNMVDGQIRPSSVTDWRIIDAMRVVPREAFVPASQRALAYLDFDLDVSGTGAVKQYLIKPVVTARMLQAADITDTDNVLVVGCASGYAAALASKLAGRVTATVSAESTATQAREILSGLGFGKVTVRTAAAAEGYASDSPYDVIVLNGATEIDPIGLYEQLRIGGRLVGVFVADRLQRATIVTRSNCDFGSRVLFDTSVPVLPGLERAPAFVF
jgi:protein-L-isoaspartate(D-aspartate) O-methyltransferase